MADKDFIAIYDNLCAKKLNLKFQQSKSLLLISCWATSHLVLAWALKMIIL